MTHVQPTTFEPSHLNIMHLDGDSLSVLAQHDTGCVFGGKLTALRYPGKEFVSTPAHRTYYEPAKPLVSTQAATALSQQHEQDDVLDIDDVIGKRIVETRFHGNLTVREENAIARFIIAANFTLISECSVSVCRRSTVLPRNNCGKSRVVHSNAGDPG
jgi:hypothetical protein